MPRPPLTTTGASFTSSLALALASMEATFVLPSVEAARVVVAVDPPWAGAKALTRVVATKTPALLETVAMALPAIHGRVQTSLPPSEHSAVTSESRVQSSKAATRGATSLPVAVAAARNAVAPDSLTMAARSFAKESALCAPPPTSATALVAPSAAAQVSAPSPPTTAMVSAPVDLAAPSASREARRAAPLACSM